ncbi:peroxidase isoform X1 [Maniola jurtina]|uniref:peroxidase isoform X1 n=1 Tax=Maniola jurtina TaxID=191418 RepID=UPI001E68C64C|nr:peroxidase isoform X1 [Maniola jurtina]XP_045777820.1 peroxidase isoform X1 [Maniola jurtina]
MQRPTTSTERTPLVQPTYMFESSVSRSYQKRLRHFQCAICVILLSVLLSISLLIMVSYSLSQDTIINGDNGTAPGNLTLLRLGVNDDLLPLLNRTWPLDGQRPPSWTAPNLTSQAIAAAVVQGKDALKKRRLIEKNLIPLASDSPASRAQRAAATSSSVKPLAETAFAAEEATRVLLNGTDRANTGGIGFGPPTNSSFEEPAYCRPPTAPCPLSKYRSQDGTCNNLDHPILWGVTNTPFRRVLPAAYGDGISSPREGVDGASLPSARDVSVTVHRPSYAHDSQFTVMLAVWGQFIDHDITATALSKGENSSSLSCCDASNAHPECFPVRLDPEDPYYQDYNLTCMEFVRSAPAPTCHFGPREQLNQATAFLDASAVYSFSETKTYQLREGVNGQLRMLKLGPWELLPPSTDPNDGCNTVEMSAKGRYCFESGDDRANENLHLTTMHLIWARQHNRLAAILKKQNPVWDDETVFQETRRIVGAQMQHITYAEFLPAILGQDVMWALNLTLVEHGYADVYDRTVDPSIANHFSAAAFRFAHTLLPGLIHNVDATTGTVSYTQLHEMLFNPYALYAEKGPKYAVKSALNTPVHSVDPHITTELSEHLFERSPANASSSVTPAPHSIPCGLDLVSLNIQRGRDHGLPAYPAWREHCGLSRPKNFTDLEQIFDPLSLSRINNIYRSVDDIDLYTGALAEEPRGRLLGPTLTCMVADQFLRLKVGDRFWYETSDEIVGFSLEQLTEIRKTTLAGVICANEQLLDQAQPRVMEALSATNPLVDCKELPQPDFKPWKLPGPSTPSPQSQKSASKKPWTKMTGQ